MSDDHEPASDATVLVLAPTSKDATLTHALLSRAGIAVEICPTFDAFARQMTLGPAAALLSEEVLSSGRTSTLSTIVDGQAPWSDLPVLILTRQGADSAELGEAVRTLGNVTLLERPLRIATLLSAIRTALRARARRYQIRGYLADRARIEASLLLADQRKDEFLATLGHELRNPLAPLLTGLQLLKATALHDPAVQRVSTVMERQVGHLTRLVDDLLEVSRITRGVIEVNREPIDLAAVVQSAVDTNRPAMDAAGHELRVELPSEPITVEGDVVRLTQVFANLLGNATKYTNVGGHVWLTVRKERDRAVVSVRDDGIGIAPAQLGAVFDMFTQVDRSSRRSQGGLGIGLTLVRSLVTMHRGRVEARSAGPGCGSEFVVELPLLDGLHVAANPAESPRQVPARRILVVDDNTDAADTLGALLDSLGATVSVSHSGREAMEALDAFHPDAVLLDIGMPGMDGYEVARRIRATATHDKVLLIALTGWGQEHDQQRARTAGFNHHMVKPPDIDQLRDVLSAGWSARTE